MFNLPSTHSSAEFDFGYQWHVANCMIVSKANSMVYYFSFTTHLRSFGTVSIKKPTNFSLSGKQYDFLELHIFADFRVLWFIISKNFDEILNDIHMIIHKSILGITISICRPRFLQGCIRDNKIIFLSIYVDFHEKIVQ